MARYLGRRLLQAIPVFFGATLLIYFMVFSLPGDPVLALGGDKGVSDALAARACARSTTWTSPSWSSTCCTSRASSPGTSA